MSVPKTFSCVTKTISEGPQTSARKTNHRITRHTAVNNNERACAMPRSMRRTNQNGIKLQTL